MRGRDLEVYKKAFSVSLNLHKLSDTWPKHELFGGLADQMRRASRGICANLVEGLAKVGAKEQQRFLNMAIGSSEEILVWLDFALGLNYMSEKDKNRLELEYLDILRMLVALYKRRDGAVTK